MYATKQVDSAIRQRRAWRSLSTRKMLLLVLERAESLFGHSPSSSLHHVVRCLPFRRRSTSLWCIRRGSSCCRTCLAVRRRNGGMERLSPPSRKPHLCPHICWRSPSVRFLLSVSFSARRPNTTFQERSSLWKCALEEICRWPSGPIRRTIWLRSSQEISHQ